MRDVEENKRLTNLWYSFRSRVGEKRKFKKDDFIVWYKKLRIEGCYYCGLSEEQSRDLVLKLPSKRFPNSSKLERGKSRGYNLEIDRKDPNGNYSEDNCVLSCYFCNNDKSDVFNHDQYMEMLHGEYWENKIQKNKKDNIRYQYLLKLWGSF
tara:strand:- start:225 stop:680 length:456 start_codon:yes stop_codon:yes gene_type:complete